VEAINALPEFDKPSYFNLPENIERASQRIVSGQVISQLRVLMRADAKANKFDKELWQTELSPILNLWKRLNQVCLMLQLLVSMCHTGVTQLVQGVIQVSHSWYKVSYRCHTVGTRCHTGVTQLVQGVIQVLHCWYKVSYRCHTVGTRCHTSVTYTHIIQVYTGSIQVSHRCLLSPCRVLNSFR